MNPNPWVVLPLLTATVACQSSAYGPWPRRLPPGTQREYACVRATRSPVLDGVLDDPEWKKAPWTEPFVDARDPDGPRPRFETWGKMLWDSRCLYVAAVIMDGDVRASGVASVPNAWASSSLEVLIDRGSGGTAWFEVQVDPKGEARGSFWQLVAGRMTTLPWSCPEMDGGLGVRGTVDDASDTDRGWVVEVAIPWACLAPPSGAVWDAGEESGLDPVRGDELRINLIRRRAEPGPEGKPSEPEVWSWTPTWSRDARDPSHWVRVRFTR